MAGAQKYGASKIGVLGSVVGMLMGMLFLIPWGVVIGAFIGAVCGESLAGRIRQEALRAGWGVFIGNLAGIGLKLAYSGVVLVVYIVKMF